MFWFLKKDKNKAVLREMDGREIKYVTRRIRKENECFKEGKFIPIYANMGHIAYIREYKENSILIAVNRWCDDAFIDIPDDFKDAIVLLGNKPDGNTLKIDKENICILKRR